MKEKDTVSCLYPEPFLDMGYIPKTEGATEPFYSGSLGSRRKPSRRDTGSTLSYSEQGHGGPLQTPSITREGLADVVGCFAWPLVNSSSKNYLWSKR